MSFERAKYEFPIDVIDQHHRADAPTGIYLLAGEWRLAVHDSVAEMLLVDAGALLVATLTFDLPRRPGEITEISGSALLHFLQVAAS
ncbi:MAG TPA: hypothetical protein VFO52_01455 [Longimicrobiales bacterium]|nr:hypothetical protein [Longimicrobiales bacterium]